MAKPEKGGRMRVFFAEFEGDSETLQEGLRAVTAAVHKTFQPTIKHLLVNNQQSPALLLESEITRPDEEENDEEAIELMSNGPKPRSPAKRSLPQLTLVKDLDLRPEGKQSLRDLYSQKGPVSQLEKCAVFVYYLRRILEVESPTPNHVYTCYKHVDVKPPKDLPQTLRKAASKHAWVKTANGVLDITTHGESFVDHDLPHGASLSN